MRRTILCVSLAVAAAGWSGIALAQSPGKAVNPPAAIPPSAPAATPPAGGASTAAAPAPSSVPPAAVGGASTAAAAVSVGLPVKDNTGAVIGQVSDLKADASGKQMATVTMGQKRFAVDASVLAVRDGAANINATQAQLQQMIAARGG